MKATDCRTRQLFWTIVCIGFCIHFVKSDSSTTTSTHPPYVPLSIQANDDPSTYNQSAEDLHWSMILNNFHPPFHGASEYGGAKCEPLEVPICKNLWYNQTKMPNRFHHITQYDAGQAINQFVQLINTNCSSDLHFFLCSLFTPICLDDYSHRLEPCRPVCERARKGCEPFLRHHNFQWPSELDCSLFPLEDKSTDKICMDKESQYQIESSHQTLHGRPINQKHAGSNNGIFIYHPINPIQPNNKADLAEMEDMSIADEYIDMVVTSEQDKNDKKYAHLIRNEKCKCRCHSPYTQVTSKLHPLYNKVRTGTLLNCMQPCFSGLLYYYLPASLPINLTSNNQRSHSYSDISPQNLLKSEEEHANFIAMQSWLKLLATLSAICVVANLIRVSIKQTVKTLKQKMLLHAEHGVEWRQHSLSLKMSLCHLSIIGAFSIRLFAGHRRVACAESPISPWEDGSYLVTPVSEHAGASRSLCVVSFLLLYYGSMGSFTWWLFSTLEVFLVHAKQWEAQRLSHYTKPLEYIAWILPAIQTVICLMLPSFDTDSVSGVCFVGGTSSDNLIALVIGPALIYLIAGWMTLLLTSITILSYRNQPPSNSIDLWHNFQYLFSNKFTMYTFLSSIPRSLFIFTLLIEYHQMDSHILSKLCPCKKTSELNKLFLFYKFKYFLWFLICIFDLIIVVCDVKSFISSVLLRKTISANGSSAMNSLNTTHFDRFKRDLMLTSVHRGSEQRLVTATPIGSTISSEAYTATPYSTNPVNQNENTPHGVYAVDSDSQHYASTSRLLSYSKNIAPKKV